MTSYNLLKVKRVTIRLVLLIVKNVKALKANLKEVTQRLDTLAANPDASFDILIRAFKASVLARNLDLGTAHTTKEIFRICTKTFKN